MVWIKDGEKVDVAQEDPDRRQRLAGGGGRGVSGEMGGGNQTKAIEFVDRCSTIQYLTAYVCSMGQRPTISGGERQEILILLEVKTGSDKRR